jgi:hypothetical protein
MESGAAVGEGKVGWEELGHCILSGAAASIWSEPNFNAIINGADCFLFRFPFFSCRVCRVRWFYVFTLLIWGYMDTAAKTGCR